MKKPILLAVILVAADQITKFFADTFVRYGSSVSVVPFFDFFNITNVRNTGAAFSMFQGRNVLFLIVIIVFLTVVGIWLSKNHKQLSALQKYAFALILAGGAGNLIDRIFRGAVVDFLDFGVNNLRWPSFNIADSCICIAAALIFLDLIKPFFKRKQA